MINRCLTALAAFVAVFAFTTVTACAQENDNALVGKPAPEFTLTTLDGKEMKLSDQKGSVVVLDFWATWCPPCRKAMPHLQKLSIDKARADKGLRIYAVNLREKPETVEKFLKDNGYTFPVPMDNEGAAAAKYSIKAIPTTVIVGRDGTVQNVFIGLPGDEKLDGAIDAALAKGK
jgi:DsbE subfamily thiol:disulfide oxidoreductase